MPTNFNDSAIRKIAAQAFEVARLMGHQYCTREHILAVLLEHNDIKEFLTKLEVDVSILQNQVDAYLKSMSKRANSHLGYTSDVQQLISRETIAFCLKIPKMEATVVDLLMSMVIHNYDAMANYFLAIQGLTKEKIHALLWGDVDEQSDQTMDQELGPFAQIFGIKPQETKMDKKRAYSILAKYADNLNERAKKGGVDPLIGRTQEVYKASKILRRRLKNNLVLVAEPGVGKTAIVEGLAKLTVEGKVPEAISKCVYYAIDMGAMMAGAKFRGDFEERLKQVLNALIFIRENTDEEPVAFIDEIHMMIGAGAGGEAKSMDMSNLIKPYLAKGVLRCIGATTYEEYRKHFEKDRALLRRFTKLDVAEPSISDAIQILYGLKPNFEQYHAVTYTNDAIEDAVKLSARYITNRFLPDKAIDLLDAAGATQRIVPEDQRVTVIDSKMIRKEISEITNIEISEVEEDDRIKFQNLESQLKYSVFDQDEAINMVTDAVLVARAGLREANKPEGIYLFTGPTGVGKTEVAKQLAKVLGRHFARINMSEYMEKHAVSRLVGAPPGYVGYENDQGVLTSIIEAHPNAVILLDEIEKAHPDVYNIFLQVYDDGQFANNHGKDINARNAIFIMTTNAGAADAEKGSIGFNRTEFSDDKQDDALKAFLSPEFRNRLDAIIKFNKLSHNGIKMVVDKFINELNFQLIDKKVNIKLTDKAHEWFAREGYDPKMGARPLARVIHTNLKIPVSKEILFGRLVNGGNVIIDVKSEKLTFNYVVPTTEAVTVE